MKLDFRSAKAFTKSARDMFERDKSSIKSLSLLLVAVEAEAEAYRDANESIFTAKFSWESEP